VEGQVVIKRPEDTVRSNRPGRIDRERVLDAFNINRHISHNPFKPRHSHYKTHPNPPRSLSSLRLRAVRQSQYQLPQVAPSPTLASNHE
jgi:hypothetical protein